MEIEKTQFGAREGAWMSGQAAGQSSESMAEQAAEKSGDFLEAEKYGCLPAENAENGEVEKNPDLLNDKQLLQLCQEYGMNARKWSRKFAALLPEVSKRELYIRHGFYSIYEFAAKLGGLNQKTVDEVLRVYRRVEDKPLLRAEIENQGWGKVRTVAAIATTENEETLAGLVKTLPKKALEEYVRGVKGQEVSAEVGDRATNSIDVSVNSSANKFVCSATPPGWGLTEENRCEEVDGTVEKWVRMSFKLDPETELRLRKYQQELEKERKQAVGFNEVVKSLLDGAAARDKHGRSVASRGKMSAASSRQEKPAATRKKLMVDRRRIGVLAKARPGGKFGKLTSRYIPAEIRRRLDEKYQGRCGYPGCNKPHEVLHHPRRFALTKNHEDIVPLCHEHHQIAHVGLIEEDGQEEKWRLREEPDRIGLAHAVDRKVQQFRGVRA